MTHDHLDDFSDKLDAEGKSYCIIVFYDNVNAKVRTDLEKFKPTSGTKRQNLLDIIATLPEDP